MVPTPELPFCGGKETEAEGPCNPDWRRGVVEPGAAGLRVGEPDDATTGRAKFMDNRLRPLLGVSVKGVLLVLLISGFAPPAKEAARCLVRGWYVLGWEMELLCLRFDFVYRRGEADCDSGVAGLTSTSGKSAVVA